MAKRKAASKAKATNASKPTRVGKKAASGRGAFGAKAAFVRAHPERPAKEIVALAAKAGLRLTVNHVYNVRSTSGISRRRGSVTVRESAVKIGKRPHVSRAVDAQFRRLVLDVGVERARVMLDEIASKLTAIVEGR